MHIATLGPVGRLPVAPGTWGSLVGVAIWEFGVFQLGFPVRLAVIGGVALLAVWVSGLAETTLGKDARPIVIDEVVGQWVALLWLPQHLFWVVASFILFRAFDVIKPFPVGVSQKLKGGWGVVADDVLAGLYTAGVLYLIRRFVNV